MIWILALLALFSPPALGQDPQWAVKPYAQPTLRFGLVAVNGTFTVQSIGGGEAGVRYRYGKSPHWMGRTRFAATLLYSLTAGSLGGDLRLGSFFGPDTQYIRVMMGPDWFYNAYGRSASRDYWLPPTFGVSWATTIFFKLHKSVGILTGVSPGWVFNKNRRATNLGPFHELSVMAALVIHTRFFGLTVGYQRSININGNNDSLILAGGF